MDIGKKILLCREACGFTQSELAKKCGMSIRSISMYENNEGNVSLSNLEKIAGALKVTLCYLVSEDVDKLSISNVDKSSISMSPSTTVKPQPRYSKQEEELMAWYDRLSEDDKDYYFTKIKGDALESMRYRKNNPEKSTENNTKNAA
jgi:transcriptional regulator with XRE-family HTH domain